MLNRHRERQVEIETISDLRIDSKNVFVIHYSCEDLYESPHGRTPRITSIAICFLSSGQTKSFSIHKIAEKMGIEISKITENYDKLELEMLIKYFIYIEKYKDRIFIHWNMRDNNYGFSAIEHRYEVLGKEPFELDDSKKFDLGRALKIVYGKKYMDHGKSGRFLELCKYNDISQYNALSGLEEAQAFKNGSYVRLHLSTLRKVAIIKDIFEMVSEKTLKTKSQWMDMYGWHPAILVHQIRQHWMWALFLVIVTILGAVLNISDIFNSHSGNRFF